MQINKRSRAELKQYFVRNAIPTESNFAEFIDAMLNQREDGLAKPPNEALSIEAAGDDASQKRAINLYNSFSDANPTWVLTLNPRQDPADAATAKAGFSIGDGGTGISRLFIDQNTGNVGIGTLAPSGAKLQVAGAVKANRFTSDNALVLNDYTTPNPASNVYLASPGQDRDSWIFRDDTDPNSNWGIYHRQIDTEVKGLPGNSISFIGGGNSELKAYVGLRTGNAYFAGQVGIGKQPELKELKLEVDGRVRLRGNGGVLQVVGSTCAFIEFYPQGMAAGRKGWIGQNYEGKTDLEVKSEGVCRLRGSRIEFDGPIYGGSKMFRIDHPLDSERYLVHSVIEGPEAAVFYRGEASLVDGQCEIELPSYFEALTRKENRTVLVTPKLAGKGETSALAASDVLKGRFVVRAIDQRNPTQPFFWEVKAVRADIDPLEVEPLKSDFLKSGQASPSP